MHGINGDGGFWRTRNVPKRYDDVSLSTLPIEKDNPKTYQRIVKYIEGMEEFIIEKNVGLYLFSTPSEANKFGTGTGKTTTAITILNEFVIMRVTQHVRGERKLSGNPALFVRSAEYQNLYNDQYKGGDEARRQASEKFSRYKKAMLSVELLVIDDIAVRGGTEAFLNEMYELVDTRANNGGTTIYTSNVPINEIGAVLGERIASRIEGMAVPMELRGEDKRKGGLF
jgi:DNA replication protein DnaC